MKKVYALFLMVVILLIFAMSRDKTMKAQEEQIPIPARMEPHTVIVYDENLNVRVIHRNIRHDDNKNIPITEDTSGREEEDRLVAQIHKEAESLPHYYEPDIFYPSPNTIVVYSSDGMIGKIRDLNEEAIKTYIPEDIQSEFGF